MFIKRIELALLLIFISFQISGQYKKPVTFKDIMQFKQIKNPIISNGGKWIGYNANPDRGNEEAIIKSVNNNIEYNFVRGVKPVFSGNEKWSCIMLLPDFLEREKDKKNIKNDLMLIDLNNGDADTLRQVKNFMFSENSNWLAVHLFNQESDSVKSEKKKDESEMDKSIGTDLLLINLNDKSRQTYNRVSEFTFDSLSNYMAFFISDTSGNNGLYVKDLNKEHENLIQVDTIKNGNYTGLTWHKKKGLAYLRSVFNKKGKPGGAELYLWNNKKSRLASEKSGGESWFIPAKNKLHWTNDGERLFFGYKPKGENNIDEDDQSDSTNKDIYNYDKLLSKKEMDVWHWKDPLIKPNEKENWKIKKDRTFPAVVHLNTGKIVKLADSDIPFIEYSNNPEYVFGYSDVPYLIESTWDDEKFDNYIIDLNSGERFLAASKIRNNGSLSPKGKYLVYYSDKHWHLYSTKNKKTLNLTENLDVPFYDEDYDYPSEIPGYGIAGWTENDGAVLLYDKYDIWKFNTSDGAAINITDNAGRKNKIQFRVYKIDPDAEYFSKNDKLLLSAYYDLKKYTSLYSATINNSGVNKLLDGKKKFSFIAKAKNTEIYMFTRQSYEEYPDLRICGPAFKDDKKLTDLGSQFNEYKWGSPELVEWSSIDGIKLQGILIKPDNYDPEKKYPVFVYYYRFFTPRMYDFPEIILNHRPKYPVLLSEDYCVFLPDIRFEIGRPGYSATKCLVPGVQKLIDMGVADPKAIALHGHSWSGYQTAFVVTQTNIFKCAIAGAPVSNMTSAYSGIRWGSGKARQFQYEKAQSRIGGSLWEYPERYYENSTVFFADKIKTPLLIMHGDLDEAVPWYQSIELYLAMRRLSKDCVFLQYRGEPHHLTKYPNKLDYLIKMMEYLDYHLKGKAAPEWITKGEPYIGK